MGHRGVDRVRKLDCTQLVTGKNANGRLTSPRAPTMPQPYRASKSISESVGPTPIAVTSPYSVGGGWLARSGSGYIVATRIRREHRCGRAGSIEQMLRFVDPSPDFMQGTLRNNASNRPKPSVEEIRRASTSRKFCPGMKDCSCVPAENFRLLPRYYQALSTNPDLGPSCRTTRSKVPIRFKLVH